MASASLLAEAASGPLEPSSRNGKPTMSRVASWLRAISARRLARLSSGSAGTVAKAWAIVSLGSLIASPTRFDPGSTASILTDPVCYGDGFGVGLAAGVVAVDGGGVPDSTT